MATAKSTKSRPEFPLTARADGRFCKKVRGVMYYFGRDGDADLALMEWNEQKDAILSGKAPRVDAVTLTYLANHFLTYQEGRVNVGELSETSWRNYRTSCSLMLQHFGRHTLIESVNKEALATFRSELLEHFSSPLTAALHIRICRMVLLHAFEFDLIREPIRMGKVFSEPKRARLKKHKREKGDLSFTRDEILAMLDRCQTSQERACVLLAINCAYGCSDLVALLRTHISGEFVSFVRPKTEVERKAWLWTETRDAIGELQNGHSHVFVSRSRSGVFTAGTLADLRLRPVFKAAGVADGRRGPYSLRRTFATVASETLDREAINVVMGHADGSMAAVYVQRISDERVKAVCEYVRDWLFGGS